MAEILNHALVGLFLYHEATGAKKSPNLKSTFGQSTPDTELRCCDIFSFFAKDDNVFIKHALWSSLSV